MARKVSGDEDLERKIRDGFHAQAPVPLVITADLEGSRMSQPDGVVLPNPLGIASVDDLEATERVTEILAMDGLANGIINPANKTLNYDIKSLYCEHGKNRYQATL